MRLYLGTAALQVGVGFILGALLGYLVGVAVQRWRHVRELRRIGATVKGQLDREAARRNAAREGWPSEPIYTSDPVSEAMLTELRRRKL